MNEPRRTNQIHERELTEPDELHTAVPLPFALFAVAIIAWGAYYFYVDVGALMDAGDRRTAIVVGAAATVDGATLYRAQCAACHQASGTGLSAVFPPLAGSKWVTADESLLLQILLHGMNGPLLVKDIVYQGQMPSFATLSDEEIAALASHVRSSWGNTASLVEADRVHEERAASIDQQTPWQGGQSLQDWLDNNGTE